MKLVDDPGMAKWLAEDDWHFEWDEGNRTKNSRKHGVEETDIESLFNHAFLLEGLIVEPKHSEPRWLVLGVDARSRRLALIFTIRANRLRPISCRAMRGKERMRYEEVIQRQSN